jgi:hypothetical protein
MAGVRRENTMTWVLIFAMYAAPFADTDFATVHSQEFSSKENCEQARVLFEREFQTAKSINSLARCVQK